MSKLVSVNCLYPLEFKINKDTHTHARYNYITIDNISSLSDLYDYIRDRLLHSNFIEHDDTFVSSGECTYRSCIHEFRRGTSLKKWFIELLKKLLKYDYLTLPVSAIGNMSYNHMTVLFKKASGLTSTCKFNLLKYSSIKDIYQKIIGTASCKEFMDRPCNGFAIETYTMLTPTKVTPISNIDDLRWAIISMLMYHIILLGYESKYADFDVWKNGVLSNDIYRTICTKQYDLYYCWRLPELDNFNKKRYMMREHDLSSYGKHVSGNDLKSLTQEMCEDVNSVLSFTNGTFYNVGFEVIVRDETGSFYNRYYGEELSITTIVDQINSSFADKKKSMTVNIPDIVLYADNHELLLVDSIDMKSYDSLRTTLLNLRNKNYCKSESLRTSLHKIRVYLYGHYNELYLPTTGYEMYIEEFCKRVFETCKLIKDGGIPNKYLDRGIISSNSDVEVSVDLMSSTDRHVCNIFRHRMLQCKLEDFNSFCPSGTWFEGKLLDYVYDAEESDCDEMNDVYHSYLRAKVKVGNTTYTRNTYGKDTRDKLMVLYEIMCRQLGFEPTVKSTGDNPFANAISKLEGM